MVTYGNHAMVQEGILDLRVESACPLDDPGAIVHPKAFGKFARAMFIGLSMSLCLSQLAPQLVRAVCTVCTIFILAR